MSKSRKILGKGTFGCVMQPEIPCGNKQKSGNADKVSKLIMPKNVNSKNIKRYMKYFKYEIEIAKKLKKIDPNNVYFLGGEDFCILQESKITDPDIKNDIKNCLHHDEKIKIKRGKDNDYIFNIPMKFAQPLLPEIAPMLRNSSKIMYMFAHVVSAVQKIVQHTSFLFMDIKLENILLNFQPTKNDIDYVHPVLIDFTPDHIINTGYYNFARYVSSFETFYQDPWSPETLFAILEHVHTNASERKIANMVIETQQKKYAKLPKKIQKQIEVFGNAKKAFQSILNSKKTYIDAAISTGSAPKFVRERIMLWEVGNMLLPWIPKKLKFTDAPKEVFNGYLNILLRLVSLKLNERPSCSVVLREINSLLDIPQNTVKNTKYMLQLVPM